MSANVRDPGRVRLEHLHCYNRAMLDRSFGDYERISNPAAFEDFLLLNILLKMRDRNKSA